MGMIVFGTACGWWDKKEYADMLHMPSGHRLPCCPHCECVLVEIEESEWWERLNRYEQKGPGYLAFMKWQRGKCFKTMEAACVAYKEYRDNKSSVL